MIKYKVGKECVKMNTKTKTRTHRIISILLTLLLIFGMSAAGGVTANAATTTINVKILSVTRRYAEAKSFLDMINSYRAENGKNALAMDTAYLEGAMIRAAELSLYASSYSPNGKNGTEYIKGASDGGQIIGYDVRSMLAVLNDFQQNAISNSLILNSNYKSAGIGIISVNGYKFVCVLVSTKNPTPVADTVLAQTTVSINQEIETKLDILSNMAAPYPYNASILCGGAIPVYTRVTNKLYPTVSVNISPDNATVSLSDTSVFRYSAQDQTIMAISPGECTMRITYANSSLYSVACKVIATGKSLGDCKFSDIPDQIYTGSAICPDVTVKDSSGTLLIKGKDYTVEYANNVNVGRASVTIHGKGYYELQNVKLYFNIVNGGGDSTKYIKVTAKASNAYPTVGDTIKMTALISGGTAPIKYSFAYTEYGSSNWVTLASNSSNASCYFKPTAAKMYSVKVSAVDANGLTSSQTASITASNPLSFKASASPEKPAVGGTITLSTSATGGARPLQYAFLVMPPSSSAWKTIKSYGSETTANYHPAAAGTYQFCVKCKTKAGDISKQYLNVKVIASNLVNKSSVSATSINLGDSITLNGSGSGGATPYTYAYYYKKASTNTWHTIKDYSLSTTATLKPTVATKYNICIKVKDAGTAVQKKYFDLNVNTTMVNQSTISSSSITLGQTITLKGVASGGSSSYQYAYWYRPQNQTNFSKIKDYSSTTSVTFKPTASGKFYFRVKVKDAGGKIINKDFYTVVTRVELFNKSSVNTTSVAAGKAVTVNCAGSGGVGSYEYCVYYMKPGKSAYTLASAYGTSATRSITLSDKGKYTLRVKVKDSVGTVENKDFTVTAT